MCRCLPVLLLTIALSPLAAQRSVAPYRYLAAPSNTANRLALPSLRHHRPLPAAHRMAALTAADLAPRGPVRLATRAGIHRAVDARVPLESGRWDRLDDGRAVWRLVLQSPGAAGVRIHFRDFHLEAGARVWIHDGTGALSEIMGPYEGGGIYDDGEFWSDFAMGDAIVIEYEPAAGDRHSGDPLPFTIAGISHLLPGALAESPKPETLQALASPLSWTGAATADPRQAAASCNLDVTCFPDWGETARAVAQFVFEEDGSSYVCSGTLLSTTTKNNIPYFLTADHCVSNDTIARTVQAFWHYETSRCDGPAPNKRDAQRSLGARYLVSEGLGRGDYSLIRLNSVPNSVVFSGWTTEAFNIGSQAVGIHHPTGDYKRFSRGARVATGSQLRGANPAFYYTVSYSEGIIEGGSSGSGLFAAPGRLVGMLSSGPKTETPCNTKPFPANYGKFSDVYPNLREYLEGRTTGIPNTGAGSGAPQVLTSGTPREFSVGPVNSATVFNASSGFAIDVPPGATRLTLRVALAEPGPELGFWVRYDAAPASQNGRVVADFTSPGSTGFEEITIDSRSNPALRAGRYYIALGLFSTGVTARGTITATVSVGESGGGGGGEQGNGLVSGVPVIVEIPAVSNATLRTGALAYRMTVPEGATRLDVRLSDGTAGIDYDLFVRRGSPPGVENGGVVADYRSEGDTGDEFISITSSSSPGLVPGSTYYIAIAVFTTGRAGRVTLTATITGGTPGGGGATGTLLTPGTPANLAIPAVSTPRLLAGAAGYRVTVPPGTQRLELQLRTGQEVDLDLYVRPEAPPAVQDGKVQADYRAAGPTGNETVVITGGAGQPLSGTYYVGVGVFTTNVDISATLLAVVAGDGTPSGPVVLQPGVARNFSLPAVANPQLALQQYAIDVPEGATRLELRLASATPGVDLDLYARHNAAPGVVDGRPVADHTSEGATASEVITITRESTPPLRVGRYFVALGVFTTGVAIDGSLVASVVGGGGGLAPPPEGSRVITPQSPVKFNLPAVDTPTLFNGDYSFRVTVPEGTRSMQLRLTADTPSVDTDLYVRYGSDVELAGAEVVADHSAEGSSGNELLAVNLSSVPPLRAGTYYVSLGLFTRNNPASGTISVTFEREVAPPPPPSAAGRELPLGETLRFQLPAAANPTLYRGDYAYRVTVPSARGRLEVKMKADDPAVDVDLYLRFGAEPAVENGSIVADHRAQGDTGDETLAVAAPSLRAGTYYVAFGVFTPNREARGTLAASFTPEPQSAAGAELVKEYDLAPELVAPPELELTKTQRAGPPVVEIGPKQRELKKARKPYSRAEALP